MATALSINLNKIALIRNSREGNYPCIIEHTAACLAAGADGITVHPRPDQRHIRAEDCYAIADYLAQNHPSVEFNIEGNPFAAPMPSQHSWVSDYPGFMPLVKAIRPAQCTLVPDSNQQLTSDHGFDLLQDNTELENIIAELKSHNIRVSLFMDPIAKQIEQAKNIGADRIEFYTGPYAAAFKQQDESFEALFQQYVDAAKLAKELGLGLNAGHDLNLDNLSHFSQIESLLEVSIGHAFTVDCIAMGLTAATKAYQACLSKTL